MNRHERRAAAAKGDRFVAKCLMCAADSCEIHVIQRLGKKDMGICKGCPCSTDKCAWCDRIGEHWLGCPAVGLPSKNPDRVLQ